MLNYCLNNNLFRLSVLLVFLGITCRILFFWFFGKEHLNFEVSSIPVLYFDAIQNHTWEFIKHYHYKPIGIVLRDVISFYLFGEIEITNFILTSFFDIWATILLASILFLFSVNYQVIFVSCFIFSINLIGWEYWRAGNHFDHLNVFLFSFYIWSIIKFIYSKNIYTSLLIGISSGLLILFYSLGYIIIPIILIFLTLFIRIKITFFTFINMFLFPIIILLIVLTKNFLSVGILAPSSLGGQNTLQFSAYSKPDFFGFDSNNLIKISKKVKMKKWWNWCFEQAVILNPQNPLDAQTYGKCYIKNGDTVDFTDLKIKLNNLKEIKLLKVVELDETLLKTKPWYFSNSNSFNFTAMYMQESIKIWKYLILNEPFEFLKRTFWATYHYLRGVRFFTNTRYESKLMIKNNFIKLAALLVCPLLFLGVISSFFKSIQLFSYPILSLFNNKKYNILIQNEQKISIYFLSILFVLISLFLITITYGENSRMFVSVSVIPYVLGVILLNNSLNKSSFKKKLLISFSLFLIINIFFLALYSKFFGLIFKNLIK